eukprot:TRINITY_DN47835_c0_g1_i1.p1 TRINITY_DN47835_c0_g1~~TRINITY_DN47835_c0_g1_i1.p1  ORF type:complete len:346 (+),score=114.36 TRINITY_DN47835_c0_g1_i1:89-1126(+)
MTEYWVSQAKHFCDVCKTWTGGHPGQILKHKQGRGHQENEERMLKEMRKRETEREKEKSDVLKQLKEIEERAQAAMGLTLGGSAASSSAGAKGGSAGAKDAAESATKRRRTEACKWRKHQDPNSKQFYYHHKETGESRWTQPPDFFEEPAGEGGSGGSAAATATTNAAAADPAAWVVCTDPGSGKVYYYNQATKVSSWEKPSCLNVDLSRPPPPPSAKPPPPPKKPVVELPKGSEKEGTAGGWTVVHNEESVFANPDEVAAADDWDREQEEKKLIQQNKTGFQVLTELKAETERRSHVNEDFQVHAKEWAEKKSLTSGGGGKSAAFPIQRKKAGGIRKKREGDDD